MKENKVITSREQVVAAAQRHEELYKRDSAYQDKSSHSGAKSTTRDSSQDSEKSRRGSKGRFTSKEREKSASSKREEKTCGKYHKKGHITEEHRDVPPWINRKKDEGSSKGQKNPEGQRSKN